MRRLLLVAALASASAPSILDTPGTWLCEGDDSHPARTVENVTPEYALTHFCDADVCGGSSWVCGVFTANPKEKKP